MEALSAVSVTALMIYGMANEAERPCAFRTFAWLKNTVADLEMCSMNDFPLIIAVTAGDLNLDELVEKIILPTTGTVIILIRTVRGVTQREDRETEYLEYEACVPMAEARMIQVENEIRERWPLVERNCRVVAIGRLVPRTTTTVIDCASAHRYQGVFDAARYGINRLK